MVLHQQHPLTVFNTTHQEQWNLKKKSTVRDASAPRLIASSSTANVSPEEGPVMKTVFVYVVETNPKIRNKFTKPSRSQTTVIQGSLRTCLPLCRCGNVLARNLNARKSIVSVSARGSNVHRNANASAVKMENATIITTTRKCIRWGLRCMHEDLLSMIIYTCFYFSEISD